MSQGLIPAIGSKGKFVLKTPWSLNADAEYICQSLQSFQVLSKTRVDVYKNYYSPKGVPVETYQSDQASGVVIVGLRNSTGSYIFVPSSFILSVPDRSGYAYARRFVTVELGPLEVTTDTTALQNEISQLVTTNFGVNPTLREVELPIEGIVSQTDHEAIVAARRGAVTAPNTVESKYRELQVMYQALLADNQAKDAMLIQAGLIAN